ncbi:MAG: lysophospholipid acyltransferase family protein [Kouleothrix sp.]|nr:lysophospholipid acyltransferase family protein [Kouleothrix sp.]
MSKQHAADLPAIPARHSRVGHALVYWGLVRSAIWSQFDRVWISTDGPIPQPHEGPLIIYMNHPSWWDGYMAFVLNHVLLGGRFEGYAMMDEQQIRMYRFFSWSGAFSVHRQDPRSAMRSVAYVGRLLAERRDRSLYIFPQGEITPNDRRPLEVFSGVAHVVRRAGGATLWPVALRYEFRGEQRPEAFIRVGPAHHAPADSDSRALTAEVGARLTAACDALRDEVNAGRLEDYRVLLRGRAGVNRVWDSVRGRLPGRRPGD